MATTYEENPQKIDRGWIFSSTLDPIFFVIPVVLPFIFFALIGRSYFYPGLLAFVVLKIAFEMGHCFSTPVVLFRRRLENRISNFALYVGPVLTLLFALAFFNYWASLFYTVLAYFILTHLTQQQYGWVMISRRKSQDTSTPRWMDTAMLWNQVIAPVLFWQSTANHDIKLFFHHGDMHLAFSGTFAISCLVLQALLNVAYFGFLFLQWKKGHPRNYGKVLIFVTTWLCFFGGLVICQSAFLFFLVANLLHGAPYELYCHQQSKTDQKKSGALKVLEFFRWPYIYAVFILGLGTIWYLVSAAANPMNPFFVLLFFGPVIVHYYFDTFLWRRPGSFSALARPFSFQK